MASPSECLSGEEGGTAASNCVTLAFNSRISSYITMCKINKGIIILKEKDDCHSDEAEQCGQRYPDRNVKMGE